MGTAKFVAGALLLLAVPAAALDVLHLKNGGRMEGAILSETEREVHFRWIRIGKKKEIAGTADQTFARSEIERIERMTAELRRRVIARSEALGDRPMHVYQSLKAIRVDRVRFRGITGLRSESEHFEILSTCDEHFVREVTHYLEEMFTAFRQNFRVSRERDRRIPVYLFARRDEYNRFMARKYQIVLQNPAFYDTKNNLIGVCNLAEVEKVKRIRASIEAEERKADAYKDEIRDLKKRYNESAAKWRKEIKRAAAKYRREAQRGPLAGRQSRMRKVDEWEKERLRALRERLKAAKKELDKEVKKANEFIRACHKQIVHNNRILLDQNQSMFETLFHESFHAFSHNYLWLGGKQCEVPRWLEEGMACYYERSAVEAGFLIHGGLSKHRLGTIQRAKAKGKMLPLSKIVASDYRDFLVLAGSSTEHASLVYSQSWLVVHSMIGRVPLERIQEYLERINRGENRTKAFERMMGKSMKKVEADVIQHFHEVSRP